MKSQTDVQELAPEQLVAELHNLVIEAERILGNGSAESSHVTLAALRERFEAAQERLGDLYADTKQKVIAGAKCTDEAIREHPYQSLAIALGVGVLLGVLVSRRTR
jgi:ElaB/YqjD/DUF883 family membrane-anchored ribosome-binding protein